jgi:polyhydroxyalkanoate synthase
VSQAKIPIDLILAKVAEEAERAQARSKKASDVLLGPLDTDIATTPHETVYREDRIKVNYYQSGEGRLKTPLLIVYALINRETMLDLQPGRSVVQNFLKEGIDLYMIEWGYPTRKDRYLTIDDHVNWYMDNVIDFIRQRHNLDKINLMGVCMGGTFSVIYAALHPDKIQNLITTVTPSNFDTDKGLLHLWMREIDVDRLVDTFGNMPGDLLNMVFLLMNPARLMIDKYVSFLENIDNKTFVENFIRMEKWIFDSPDVPGETFRQFIKDCYQKNLLIESKMEVGGNRVNLNNVTMPLLNIYGRYDHLVPTEACELLTQKVGSEDTEDICLDTGHIGIYVSSKTQKELSPKIGRWLKDRDQTERTTPTRKPRPKKSAKPSAKAKAKSSPRKKKPTTRKVS